MEKYAKRLIKDFFLILNKNKDLENQKKIQIKEFLLKKKTFTNFKNKKKILFQFDNKISFDKDYCF